MPEAEPVGQQLPLIPTGYILRYIRCGHGCTRCPHGPYWYRQWKEGGKRHWKYIGKTLPFEPQEGEVSSDSSRAPD